MKSLGLIEVVGVTAAVDCLDIMCKSADVEFVTWERKLGGRLCTVIVEGNISAVTAAVAAAAAVIPPGRTVLSLATLETLGLTVSMG